MKLVYINDAIEDLKRLRELIAVHNPTAASKIAADYSVHSSAIIVLRVWHELENER